MISLIRLEFRKSKKTNNILKIPAALIRQETILQNYITTFSDT